MKQNIKYRTYGYWRKELKWGEMLLSYSSTMSIYESSRYSFSGDNVRIAEIAAISIVAISYNIEISQGISPFSSLLSLEST